MKFCVVRDRDTGKYFGKEYEEGYRYSSYTGADASVNITWSTLEFFLGEANESSCGLIIFESEEKALAYMKREWTNNVEVIPINDLKLTEN